MSFLTENSIELIIQEVKMRPALYQKSLKEYSDLELKKKLWEEIYSIVVPNWDQLKALERTTAGHQVQKKWMNLRTCFSRELKIQKRAKSGETVCKRRKYIYFNKLIFLKSSVQTRTNGTNTEATVEHNNTVERNREISTAPVCNLSIKRKTNLKPKDTSFNEIMHTRITESHNTSMPINNYDEDTHFALSLVPSLRELSEDEKLDAKIRILQIFKEIRMNRTMETVDHKIDIEHYPLY